jgi:catechol 2,3-dioxygenase-like lactoylglutathione lyase family enzyme
MRLKTAIPYLPVKDIKKAIQFYQAKLGFRCTYKEINFAILVRDEVKLHLWLAHDRSWKVRRLFLLFKPVKSGAEDFIAGTASARIEVDHLCELYQEYKENRVLYDTYTIMKETSWGTREFPVLDGDGNLLTFYELI